MQFISSLATDLVSIDPAWLAHWNRPVPRYTSYPTAPQFYSLDEAVAIARLSAFGAAEKPLSIYIHIPFCKSMCLFCGCSVVLNRKPEREQAYLNLLIKEIELSARAMGTKKIVSQLHFGGGTPTSLNEEQFDRLMQVLRNYFEFAEQAEIAIEVDPRTVYQDGGKKLQALRRLGFNRVSFGVQDLDPRVQEAVKRRQSEEMTVETYRNARSLGFEGINIDLIYGLPLQTPATFARTAARLVELRPDRIAFFSYAKVPWLKPHQKAIREEDLPSEVEKFQIYAQTRQTFMEAGYVAIGMDHFSLEEDSLSLAYREGRLYRNFQGYSVEKAEDLLGLGITSIGCMQGAFLQNVKTIEEYESRLAKGMLPVLRGFLLQKEDILRRWVIQQMMCRFYVDKKEFESYFNESFDLHFCKEKDVLQRLIDEGLVQEDAQELRATPIGRLFVRLIAAAFDQYFLGQGNYSKAL